MQIDGHVALVTGAGAGIGRAVALRLAEEGAAVVVVDLDEGAATHVAREIEGRGGRAAVIVSDVTKEADVTKMVALADETFGGLDILVNNAGGVTAPYFPDSAPEHWTRAIDLNLHGVMLGIHYGLRSMMRRGSGAIVNIASMGGIGFRSYDKPEYGAAKAGVVRLTASLTSLQDRGVRVNCICPGWVDTPASRQTRADMTPDERATLVPPVILQPNEIAGAVVLFIEDESLAGRVMLWPEGEPWRLVPFDAPF